MTAARNIVDDYESLKDEDYYKKYNDLIDTSGKLLEQHKILKKEHQKIKEENKELDSFVGKYQRFTEGLYKQLRKSFKGFEKAYSDFSTKLQQNEKTEAYGQFMDIIKSNVHEQDRKQQRGMDIER